MLGSPGRMGHRSPGPPFGRWSWRRHPSRATPTLHPAESRPAESGRNRPPGTPKSPGASARTPGPFDGSGDQARASPPRPITSAYHRALSFTVRRWDAKSTCTMPNRLL